MPTTRDVIARALRAAQVLGQGKTITAAEEVDCHAILQRMLNGWGIQRGLIHEVLRTPQALTSGTRDYSIGTGGTINIVRPTWVEACGFIQDSTVTDPIEVPISVFTEPEWRAVRLKTLDAGWLQGIYYNQDFDANQRGLIQTYPTINAANGQIVLYTPVAVTGFTSLTTIYLFPPGYEDAIHYNLAVRLAPEFERPVDPTLAVLARETLSAVKAANSRPVELGLPAGLPGTAGAGWSFHTMNWTQ